MNSKCIIFLLLGVMFRSISMSQTKNGAQVEQILLKMVQGHIDALQKGDTSWLKLNFSEGYTYINPLGMIISKAAAIHVLGSGAITLESSTQEEMVAHVYGDGGIVTEMSTIKGHIGNMDIGGKYRYLYVFANIQGRWQIVAEQGTSIR
jgi:ketosteroid isomerase-like protein